MAGFRIPGILCGATNALPVDGGTLAVVATPPPGPLGIATNQELSEQDLDLVRVSVRHLYGSRRQAEDLRVLRDTKIQEQAAATRHHGAQSWEARFAQATVDHLTALIDATESPYGKATEKLRKLVAASATDDELREATRHLLGIQHQRQLSGESDDADNFETNQLIGQVLNLSADRKIAKVKKLLAEANLPGNKTTRKQASELVQDMLSNERQRELLIGAGDNDTRSNEASELMLETLDVFSRRAIAEFRKDLTDARRPNSRVTKEQITKDLQAIASDVRQLQLLGRPTETDITALAAEAEKVFRGKVGVTFGEATLERFPPKDK